MVGVIKCNINGALASTYKDKFDQLGAFKPDDVGLLYLRGTDPLGVITIHNVKNENKMWMRRPQIDLAAIEKHNIEQNKILETMYRDMYNTCDVANISLDTSDSSNEPYISALNTMPNMYSDLGNGYYSARPIDHEDSDSPYNESGDDIVMESAVITESSDAISAAWSPTCLDGGSITRLCSTLEDFYIKNRKTIMALYDFAEKSGKYISLTDRCLYKEVLKKYNEYFDDFVAFSEAVAGSKDINVSADEREEKVLKATDADTNFRNSLFELKAAVMFPDAVDDFEVIIELQSFLTKVRDKFIQFEGFAKDDKISAAVVNIFGFSVTQFLSCFVNSFINDYRKLVEVLSGKNPSHVSKSEEITDAMLL